MNIFADFTQRILSIVESLGLQTKDGGTPDLSRIAVEPPRDASHGDLACNVAMVLARQVGRNPRELAQAIADALAGDSDVGTAEVAGPGFINMRLSDSYWQALLKDILTTGPDYGRSAMGKGHKVNVEYVSANPTGPMHVGHCRGAVVGDALANLLGFAGYDVTKEYYINDAGVQIDVLGRSALLRYREALGEDIGEIPAGLYPGDYLVPVGEALKAEHGEALKAMDEDAALAIAKDKSVAMMMDMIRADLAALNVTHEVFFSERQLHADNASLIRSAINDLTMKGHVYRGKLPPPKGQKPEDWEDRDQTLFRSTDVGDDIDRPLVKSDGAYTYFAADVAYMLDKYRRGFEKLIFVLGADHGGYVKRMQAAVSALSNGRVPLDVKLIQLVRLWKDGEPFKMSKRAGTFVTLRDVVEQAGRDVTRFHMLTRKNDAPLDFDFDRVLEQSKENPVWYVQYANARISSLLQKAEAQGIDIADAALAAADLSVLDHPAELELMARLAEWPRTVEIAARAHEPHRVAFYLYDLASSLHALWNRGHDDANLRFLQDGDNATTAAKIALARAVGVALAAGLAILGVTPAREMR